MTQNKKYESSFHISAYHAFQKKVIQHTIRILTLLEQKVILNFPLTDKQTEGKRVKSQLHYCQ